MTPTLLHGTGSDEFVVLPFSDVMIGRLLGWGGMADGSIEDVDVNETVDEEVIVPGSPNTSPSRSDLNTPSTLRYMDITLVFDLIIDLFDSMNVLTLSWARCAQLVEVIRMKPQQQTLGNANCTFGALVSDAQIQSSHVLYAAIRPVLDMSWMDLCTVAAETVLAAF